MKKKKIKLSNKKYILKIKKVILFDDSEFFEKQVYTDIPDMTEDELNKMINELKNS